MSQLAKIAFEATMQRVRDDAEMTPYASSSSIVWFKTKWDEKCAGVIAEMKKIDEKIDVKTVFSFFICYDLKPHSLIHPDPFFVDIFFNQPVE